MLLRRLSPQRRTHTVFFIILLFVCLISVYLLSQPSTVHSRNNEKDNKNGRDTGAPVLELRGENNLTNNSSVQSTITSTSDTVKHEDCKEEVNHIVFLKTHKTASTTLASILERFGYTRKLTFTVPIRGHILTKVDLFHRNMVPKLPPNAKLFNKPLQSYHLITNHARYNRPEMDAVVHDAKYITIIREPTANFESNFGYFEMAKRIFKNNSSINNPIEVFMRNPRRFVGQKFYMWQRARNGQLFDLGLKPEDYDDLYTVQYKIKQIDSEFDLVLLTEYFDESLILLKKIMCWSFEDILYVSNGIRSASHRYAIGDQLRERIREWNNADVMLYNHFNTTLWRKIKEYGDGFDADLAEFRYRERAAMQKCIDEQRFNKKDKREEKFVLKRNMTDSVFCKDILRGDVEYTSLIRQFMKKQGLYPSPKPSKGNVTRRKNRRKIKSVVDKL